MGVVFIPPVMSRSPAFCTLSKRCLLVLDATVQAVLPYSRVGLTVPVYTLRRMLLFAPQVVPASFFMMESFRVALFSTSLRKLSSPFVPLLFSEVVYSSSFELFQSSWLEEERISSLRVLPLESCNLFEALPLLLLSVSFDFVFLDCDFI